MQRTVTEPHDHSFRDRRVVSVVAGIGAATALASLVLMAHAHSTSTGLLVLTVSGSTLRYQLTVVPGELPDAPARLLALAAGGDRASAERVTDELHRRVLVRAGDAPCRPGRATIAPSPARDRRVVLEMMLSCAIAPTRLVIRDDWFGLFGEHYRTIARIEGPAGVREAAFLPDAREVAVDLEPGRSTPHGGFFRLGVAHILTGYDHLLFLAALLLPGGSPCPCSGSSPPSPWPTASPSPSPCSGS